MRTPALPGPQEHASRHPYERLIRLQRHPFQSSSDKTVLSQAPVVVRRGLVREWGHDGGDCTLASKVSVIVLPEILIPVRCGNWFPLGMDKGYVCSIPEKMDML